MSDLPSAAAEPAPTISQLFDLSGRVALITGARGHLGRAMADALAEAGARVIVSSRDPAAAESLARGLAGAQARGHFGVRIDQLDPASIDQGFDAAVERAGRIDILINNGHDGLGRDWESVTAEEFQRQLGNLTGYFLLARRFRDHVHGTADGSPRSGSLILIGSMYGLVGSYPDAYEGICSASPAAYHALKGGIIQLTRHLAVYWAPDGIRVNCLSPGPFPGPAAPTEMVRRLEAKSPMKRMGSPHELKGAIAFLASDASSYFTGQNLVVDGGWTAW
ncbi:MAG: SDR family oxidoreductase [Planctomycetaceae bacterium]|nr:MAG: SDR family oxidoreductase [Planctomycetaceae bacterium]